MRQRAYSSLIVVIVLLGLGLVLRACNITREFSGDETIVIRIARHDFNTMMGRLITTDVYPPLTYIAVHHLLKLNTAEVFVRSYFILFGVACCAVVYLLAREYLGEKVANIALLLSVFSPLLVFASQYVRSYIDSAFWMLLSCLFMLKILKGKERWFNWSGYILAAVLGLYTSYSVLLLLTQSLFITAVKYRSRRDLFRWYAAFFAIGLLFLPWLPSALSQYGNITIDNYNWSSKGFNLGPLRIGLYVRNILSLVGFDPLFLVYRGGVLGHFPKAILVTAALFCAGAFLLLVYYCLRFLRARYREDAALRWALPALSLGPVMMSWILGLALNIAPNTRYLVAFHALFLVMAAAVICQVIIKNRLLGVVVLAAMLAAFSIRMPQSVASEFDSKAALSYLKSNIDPRSPLICARSSPDAEGLNIINIERHLRLNADRSQYIIWPPDALDRTRREIAPFKKVWVYKTYGNAEVFGANRLLDAWLKQQGYGMVKKKEFRNIDIVEYEK